MENNGYADFWVANKVYLEMVNLKILTSRRYMNPPISFMLELFSIEYRKTKPITSQSDYSANLKL